MPLAGGFRGPITGNLPAASHGVRRGGKPAQEEESNGNIQPHSARPARVRSNI